MATYYMTAHNNSTVGYWDRCNATTETGAKREASQELGGGYNDDVLQISTGDNITEARVLVAIKRGGRWTNV